MFPDLCDLILAALSAYIIACVIGASSLFEKPREWAKRKTPFLKIGNHKHFVECRLCLTFWSSGLSALLFWLHPVMILPIYGLAYWLATQER